jgi:hypothetical protein
MITGGIVMAEVIEAKPKSHKGDIRYSPTYHKVRWNRLAYWGRFATRLYWLCAIICMLSLGVFVLGVVGAVPWFLNVISGAITIAFAIGAAFLNRWRCDNVEDLKEIADRAVLVKTDFARRCIFLYCGPDCICSSERLLPAPWGFPRERWFYPYLVEVPRRFVGTCWVSVKFRLQHHTPQQLVALCPNGPRARIGQAYEYVLKAVEVQTIPGFLAPPSVIPDDFKPELDPARIKPWKAEVSTSRA